MELISIVVPVYQVRKYLRECVDSLLGQTYSNLEILLMDDGSDDGSEKLCDELEYTDSRIRSFHLVHGGLSAARNAGIAKAKGDWIAFVDSDDWVDPAYVETLYGLAQKYDVQVAACDYVRTSVSGKIDAGHGDSVQDYEEVCLSSGNMLREWHGKRTRVETIVCNKLYKRELLTTWPEFQVFPVGMIHEDVCVSHLLVQKAQRIALTGRKLYFYRKSPNSLTRKRYTDELVRQSIVAQDTRADFFRRTGYREAYERLAVGLLLHIIKYRWTFSVKDRRLKRELNTHFKNYYSVVQKSAQTFGLKMILIRIYKLTLSHKEATN